MGECWSIWSVWSIWFILSVWCVGAGKQGNSGLSRLSRLSCCPDRKINQRNQSNQIDPIDQTNKTARSCVGSRSCHPNWVMTGNPSVALADCPAPQSSYWLASNGRAYWHRASIARPLNHHPATEAGAVPFARWLHKSGSNSNEAANLSKRSTSLSSQVIMLTSKSTRPGQPGPVDNHPTTGIGPCAGAYPFPQG